MMHRKLTRLPPELNRTFCDARFLLVRLKIRSLEGQLTDNLAARMIAVSVGLVPGRLSAQAV